MLRVYFELLLRNLNRELHSRFRRTKFGSYWIIISPIFSSLIMIIAFAGLFHVNGANIFDYSEYVLSGVVMMQTVNVTINNIALSMQNNRGVLTRIRTPKFLYPFSVLGVSLITYLIGLCLILILQVLSPSAGLHLNILSFALSTITFFAFLFGLGLIFGALTPRYNDLTQLLPIFLQALSYITPVFYSETIWPRKIIPILRMNPFTGYITWIRSSFIHFQSAHRYSIWISLLTAIITCTFGILLYRNFWSRNIIRL
jgi:ABC-2 type transport system permease protein